MKQLVIKPTDWPCTTTDCPPGFFVSNDQLCFKTEYGNNDEIYNSAGFRVHLDGILVTPVTAEWQEA
jgi:hypothetical protein